MNRGRSVRIRNVKWQRIERFLTGACIRNQICSVIKIAMNRDIVTRCLVSEIMLSKTEVLSTFPNKRRLWERLATILLPRETQGGVENERGRVNGGGNSQLVINVVADSCFSMWELFELSLDKRLHSVQSKRLWHTLSSTGRWYTIGSGKERSRWKAPDCSETCMAVFLGKIFIVFHNQWPSGGQCEYPFTCFYVCNNSRKSSFWTCVGTSSKPTTMISLKH